MEIRKRESSPANLSVKSKSTLSSERSSAPEKEEKIAKSKSAVNPQTNRNFRFGRSPNIPKKHYQKNSEKMILPPPKPSRTSTSGRSIIDNLPPEGAAINIDELEKNVEVIQSRLLRQAELLKSRNPENVVKEYKFIAVVMGEEAKLLVKEQDVRNFPNYLPAKSMEDLNRKGKEFFVACLLCFVDKLRLCQEEGQLVNCDEIYEDLKNEANEYCSIFQNWIRDFCDEADSTLMPLDHNEVESSQVGVQTEEAQKENRVVLVDCEVQTEIVSTEDLTAKTAVLMEKMSKLSLENRELEHELAQQKEFHKGKIEALEKKYKDKIAYFTDSWEREKKETSFKEEILEKEQKENKDLTQQAIDLRKQLNELMEKHKLLLEQKNQDDKNQLELEKCLTEIERLKNENKELYELKTHFLKKIGQRYEQIELQEKKIKAQKRIVESKTGEISKLKEQCDANMYEMCQIKETLESRNKIIDHLRNAVDIQEKRIREYEIALELKEKKVLDSEIGKSGVKYSKLKDIESKSSHFGGHSGAKMRLASYDGSKLSTLNTPFESQYLITFNNKCKKKKPKQNNITNSKKQTSRLFDVEHYGDDLLLSDDSSEICNERLRNVKPSKRNRDIVVRKYEI